MQPLQALREGYANGAAPGGLNGVPSLDR